MVAHSSIVQEFVLLGGMPLLTQPGGSLCQRQGMAMVANVFNHPLSLRDRGCHPVWIGVWSANMLMLRKSMPPVIKLLPKAG